MDLTLKLSFYRTADHFETVCFWAKSVWTGELFCLELAMLNFSRKGIFPVQAYDQVLAGAAVLPLCPLLACTSCHPGWFSDFRECNTTDALK
jgi:hypothetical protein